MDILNIDILQIKEILENVLVEEKNIFLILINHLT